MLKRLAILSLLLFSLLPLAIHAEPVPEENPIGETLEVEADDNVVKEYLDKEKDVLTPETDEIVVMTKRTYLTRCLGPFLWLFGGGILLFGGIETVKYRKAKGGTEHEE